MYMRGTMLGVLMLIGLGGIVVSWRGGGLRRRRNWGGPALFPWVAALTMEVVPPATADFSLRYVVPTIPVICIAAALAFARPLRGPDEAADGRAGRGVPQAWRPAACDSRSGSATRRRSCRTWPRPTRRRPAGPPAARKAPARPGPPHRDQLTALR